MAVFARGFEWLLILFLTAGAGAAGASGAWQEKSSGALAATMVPPESWEGVSQRLAVSLVDRAARAQEEPLFLPRASVRRFGQTGALSPMALRDRFDGWRVLCVEAFEYPGTQVAANISASLLRLKREDAQAMPDAVLRAMTPPPETVGAAEQTAMRWVGSALSPQKGDKLAIVLLWDASATNKPAFERLSFVMIRAGRLPDGRYRVQSVAWGTAQQAILEGF